MKSRRKDNFKIVWLIFTHIMNNKIRKERTRKIKSECENILWELTQPIKNEIFAT